VDGRIRLRLREFKQRGALSRMNDSHDVEPIPLNDALKALGVTEFTKSDDLFTIHFEGCADTLRFGLEKTREKTLENFTENAQIFKLNWRELDADTIGQFKEVFMTEEYEQFFKSQNGNGKGWSNSALGIKTYSIFKYGTGIPLAEQIKLGNEYVFLQIIDGKPVTNLSIDLKQTQKMILYPVGKTPILDFEYENEEDINRIIEVAKTKSIDDLYKWSKSIWEQLVVGTPEQISLLTADSIFTFFQDRFATTHYDMAVARVGSRKGAVLITFTFQGYRTILGTTMSGASLLDMYGLLECGQIVIAEDELNELKDDSDKRKIYTTGYDLWGPYIQNTGWQHGKKSSSILHLLWV
jgi:hypothetical protein